MIKNKKIDRKYLNKKAYHGIPELKRPEIRIAITEFFSLLEEVFLSGKGIRFAGFGTFYIKEHKARKLYSVENKCYYNTGVVKVLSFSPSGKIKKIIKRG